MMEPHMIEIYILIVFVIVVNHVGFINFLLFIVQLLNLWLHEEKNSYYRFITVGCLAAFD